MIILVVIESNADGHQAKRNIIYRLLKRSWRYQTWTHQPLTDSESKLQMNVVHRPSQVKLNPNPRLRVIMSEYFIINILVFYLYKIRLHRCWRQNALLKLRPFLDWTSVTSRELPPNPPVLTESEVSHNSVKLTWTHTGSRYMLQMFKTNNKK